MKKTILFMLALVCILSFFLVGCSSEEPAAEKPVIYFYPEYKQEIEVKLDYVGELTCTYPEYKDGWRIIAHPDGTLVDDATGKEYSYLFWEGKSDTEYDFSKGYVIPGKDTAEFLENKLAELGLNKKEINEFIVYWLPRMQGNPYNLIAFQNEIYTNSAKLQITPNPDSILRVFMVYKSLDEKIKIEEPVIEPFERIGFTVIEWGGTEIK